MEPNELPEGDRAHPALQLVRYLRDPVGFFERLGERYRGECTVRLAGVGTWVVVWSPELVKTIYTAPASGWSAGAPKAAVFGPVVGHTSSLVIDGEDHLHRRRMLQAVFRGDRVASTTEAIADATRKRMASWPKGRPFPLHESLDQIAFDAVFTGIFGTSASPELRVKLEKGVSAATSSRLLFMKKLQRDLGPRSPWGRIVRLLRACDEAIYAEIRRRRERNEIDGDDIMSLLLSARDDDGKGLGEQEIRDELMTMVVAGHEITGMSLAWFFGSILLEPRALRLVREELTPLGGMPTRENVAKLPYLEASIRESLRRRSAVVNGSMRKLTAPLELGRHTLPAGTTVSVAAHLLHLRPDLYPEPRAFRPERFLDKKINPYEWVPFGGGVRRCLGMAFALHEMKVIAATVLARAELELVEDRLVAQRRGAFVMPAGGLPVIVRSVS